MAQATQQPRIIAAMPAYNEESYIGTMVLNTRKYVDQVIIVDDGSTNNTAEIAAGVRALQLFSASGAMPIGTTLLSVLFLTIGIFSIFTGLILHVLVKNRY